MLQVGARAPEFEGTLDDGSTFRLTEALVRGPVVLYFYPKDFTMGCTREACGFRDNFEAITAAGATLIGVSADDEASHTRFREKHQLPLRLLSDTSRAVIDAYDARGMFGLGIARVTYVIDRSGTIAAAFRHELIVSRHVPMVLEALAKLAPASPA